MNEVYRCPSCGEGMVCSPELESLTQQLEVQSAEVARLHVEVARLRAELADKAHVLEMYAQQKAKLATANALLRRYLAKGMLTSDIRAHLAEQTAPHPMAGTELNQAEQRLLDYVRDMASEHFRGNNTKHMLARLFDLAGDVRDTKRKPAR